MAINHFYTNGQFGRRILVRRVFLKDVSYEALSLYVELMNSFPNYGKKKNLIELSGASVTFSCHRFSDGFIFEGRLEQTQSKVLTFLFSNPFKEAEEMFSFAFENEPLFDEKKLASSKEKLLWLNSLRKTSSLSYLKGEVLEDSVLKEIKKPELVRLSSEVKKRDVGSFFYFGEHSKKELYYPVEYKEKPVLNFIETKDISHASVKDETAQILFRVKKIESVSQKETLLSLLEALKMDWCGCLKKTVSIDFDIGYEIKDGEHFVFDITSAIGKLKSILPVLNLKEGTLKNDSIDFSSLSYYEEERKVKNLMNPEILLNQLLLEEELRLSKDENKVDAKEMFSSISILSTTISGKE